MKSWKIGAVAGLIAGFVWGLLTGIFSNIAVSMGLYEPWWRHIYSNNLIVLIPFFCFWGIIFGLIYSKVYSIIPKKGIWKGLIYCLFIYFITIFRIYFFVIPYGNILNAAGDYFAWLPSCIAFGLLLGFLYEFLSNRYYPKKELKIMTYDIGSGIFPGAVAGIIGGIAASFFAIIGHITGYWGIPSKKGEIISTIDFWLSQAGTHILMHLIWGTIFGILFAKVYNLIPGKGIKKGLYYGLILITITSIFTNVYFFFLEINHNEWELALSDALNHIIMIAFAIVFGLSLGLLYRKPTK